MSRPLAAVIVVAVLALAAASPASAAPDPLKAAQADAEALLHAAVTVDRQGQHHRLLRSLRHLKDPTLRPLFERLANAGHAGLRIHGILGLAELSPDQKVDLRRLAEIDDPAARAEVISAAMDSDLLGDGQVDQVMSWDGGDAGTQLLVASRLIGSGEFRAADKATLVDALDDSKLGRRAMAALLLHQLGDERGMEGLIALDRSNDPQRDAIRAMLLAAAIRHELSAARPWAFAIAADPDVNPRLGTIALQTALRFGDPRAVELWREQYASAGGLAGRIRLAILALQLSPYVPAKMFDPLLASDDALLRQIGRTGRAIASKDAGLADEVIALIEMQHVIANGWALSYAQKLAAPQDAMLILLGLIDAYERAPEDGARKLRRLDHAAAAAQKLYEVDPAMGQNLLRPILASPNTDARLVQAVLLGLVRAQAPGGPGAASVVDGLNDLGNPIANSLVLLLRARGDGPLTKAQLQDLGLLVRGGVQLDESLRIQAGWALLRRLGVADAALRRLLADIK